MEIMAEELEGETARVADCDVVAQDGEHKDDETEFRPA